MADAFEVETRVEACNDAASSDVALVAAALADRRQFAHLYERYADRLYRFALARTGSASAADDIVSDSMLAAMEGLAGFDPNRGSFAGWLFAIARRRVADRGRSKARLRRVIERAKRHPVDLTDGMLSEAIRRDDARLVRSLLATLSDRDRELVLLRYSAGLNSTEIAEALGMSSGAVRTRLSRTLKRLATTLSEHDGEMTP